MVRCEPVRAPVLRLPPDDAPRHLAKAISAR
jgi:hypothetical protein